MVSSVDAFALVAVLALLSLGHSFVPLSYHHNRRHSLLDASQHGAEWAASGSNKQEQEHDQQKDSNGIDSDATTTRESSTRGTQR